MKRYMLLHCGFEKPTPEIMAAWNAWFAETKERTVDMGHFAKGRELNKAGQEELPFGPDSITGFSIIEAEDFEEATAIAAKNPFIRAIRIYEIPAAG